MKKMLLLFIILITSTTSAFAYNYGGWNGRYYPARPYSNTQIYYNNNTNWVPYAAAGLVAGALIANAYQPRYIAPPAPVYVTSPPIYAPPVYQQAYVTTSYVAPPPAQAPYQPQASVLYFCAASGLYYPQTLNCATNWQVFPNY